MKALGLALVWFLLGAGPDLSKDLDQAVCCGHAHYLEALRLYGRMGTAASGEDHYRAGFSAMELHRPEAAEAPLREAVRLGFKGWEGWPSPQELLGRIKTVKEGRPPLAAPGPLIRAFSREDAWSRAVVNEVPRFARIGKKIFGNSAPAMDFFILPDRKSYTEFYKALFGAGDPGSWQDGTGNTSVVVFCADGCSGMRPRPLNDPETVTNILHEFGHGWMNTYIRQKHDRDFLDPSLRSAWFDEGTADYVATMMDRQYLNRRKEWIRQKVADGRPAPRFEDMRTHEAFYEKDPDLHYWLSALLVRRLLGPTDTGAPKIPLALDALARTGDAQKALTEVTGKVAEDEFNVLIKEFWTRHD